ncbi:MAG: hypothetical protein IIB04_00660 [Acidobacteria bacterium]|nr:hypothetical protein [Acidobacteriota bacterium]
MTIPKLVIEKRFTLQHDAAIQVRTGRLSRRGVLATGVVLAAVLLVIGAVVFTMSSPLTGVNGTGPVTTVLDATAASSDLLDATADPEVVDMAEQLNISREQAIDLFRNQGLLDDFIGTVAANPGFVAYRGPFAKGGALLIVEPGFETNEAFRNPPLGLAVRAAEVSAIQRMAGQREIEIAADSVASASIAGVAYDAFDNSYTV